MDPNAETVAVGNGLTAIVIVAIVAQVGAAFVVGVNVYVVVDVLFNAGLHVPALLFVDVVGDAVSTSPLQVRATCVNVGVVNVLTLIVIVVVDAQVGAAFVVGVNV